LIWVGVTLAFLALHKVGELPSLGEDNRCLLE
jgi:hypothetical protein